MKIGIVCYPTFGGSGVVATELGKALADRGHEIHFISYKQPVRLELLSSKIHFHEVHVPDYPLFHYQPYELALSSKLVDMVQLHQIEVLHVHYAIPHAYAGYMAKQMLAEKGINIPMVTTLHGTDITLVGRHPNYKPAVTFSINHSDIVTAVSADLKRSTLEQFEIHKEIEVVPNFIDITNYEKTSKECNRSMIAQDHQRVISHISNFRKVKHVPHVVKVFHQIQKELPSKLVLVGEGPERESVERLVDDLGIADKVLFLGNSSQVDRVLCFSDLFLLPSKSESFGLAALEAMANKVAVVSSNTGGIPEVNIHGETGYLADVGDIDTMAKYSIEILKDIETLRGFKNRAYEKAADFDILKILPQYEELYKRALSL